MPKEQSTFHFAPVSLVNTSGPTRPMTSKQAKKAYQQRQRGQKTSWAEERRLEKEEQEKQRKEREREQAAAKAKAAREKKLKKLQEEKDERKRQGLPEPSKYVRASQPTIFKFVKTNNKRSWQAMESLEEEEESDGTVVGQEYAEPPSRRVAGDTESEDEYGEFPSFSQSELPKLLDGIEQSQQTEDEDALAEMATTQLLSEEADAVIRAEDTQTQHVLEEQEVNIQSPFISCKPTRSISFAPTPIKPEQVTSISTTSDNAPSATQLYIENHLDDFLPSPSQELRELLDEIDDDDLLSNTQIARELGADCPSAENTLPVMICSQDLVFSSQDLLEIMTPSRPPTKAVNTKQPSQVPRLVLPPLQLTEPAELKEKRRFFEEKEDDLLHAAIHASKNEFSKQAAKTPQDAAVTELEGQIGLASLDPAKLIRPASALTDYGDDDIDDESLLELVADI